jgi:SAM-dependent methyltransferase
VDPVDYTKNYDYERLIGEEKAHYSDIEVTSDLKEGGEHASEPWTYYWQHVWEAIHRNPMVSMGAWLRRELGKDGRPIEVLSLGSGYCGHELGFARTIGHPCRIVCTDINEDLFSQAKDVAATENLNVEFRVADLNFIDIEPGRYHMIFAHAVLHHVINLERLYMQIRSGLTDDGVLHLVEVVGKNRELIWDENEVFANRLLDTLPDEVTGGLRLAVEPEDSGMEGVRQEDIMPLLAQSFKPLFQHSHGAFMRFICTNADLNKRFNPNHPLQKRCLDFLIECDDTAVRNGILRPLEIWGVYRPS